MDLGIQELVAADVRRLTLFFGKILEPPHVGCYEMVDWISRQRKVIGALVITVHGFGDLHEHVVEAVSYTHLVALLSAPATIRLRGWMVSPPCLAVEMKINWMGSATETPAGT